MGVEIDDGDADGGNVGIDVHPAVGLLKVRFLQKDVGGGVAQAERLDRVEEAEEEEAEDTWDEGGHVRSRVDVEGVEPA